LKINGFLMYLILLDGLKTGTKSWSGEMNKMQHCRRTLVGADSLRSGVISDFSFGDGGSSSL